MAPINGGCPVGVFGLAEVTQLYPGDARGSGVVAGEGDADVLRT